MNNNYEMINIYEKNKVESVSKQDYDCFLFSDGTTLEINKLTSDQIGKLNKMNNGFTFYNSITKNRRMFGPAWKLAIASTF